jgi:predicted small metal-binding protein
MAGTLKKIECDPKCGFIVQSHDETEVIELAREHAKKFHSETLSDEEIKAMIKDV